MIVLAIRPPLAGNGRDRDQAIEGLLRARHRAELVERKLLRALLPRRHFHRPVVDRRFIGQRAIRHVGHELAALVNPEARTVRDFADLDRVKIPFLEHRFDFVLAAALDDEQHALLRFGQHDLVGDHAGLALGDVHHVDRHAHAAARSHFGSRARESGRPHVLDAEDGAGLHDFEAGLHQQLFHERIADLDGRTLLRRLLVELRRRHGRAVNTVASGLRANVKHRIAGALGRALDDVFPARDAEAQHVDERIAGVHLVEDDLAADSRDADAVAVPANARNHAFENAARQRRVERSETQRVQQRDRTRAHREDVADDAADAGGRALVRLDERRVVVRLDLEHRAQPVADVDGAGILAGPLDDARAGGRQRLEMHARALVAAVLGPHHGEQPELEQVGLAAHQLQDAFVFVRLDAMTFKHC